MLLHFAAARVCKEGKDEFVHSEQTSLNLELLQPVADTLGSSLRSGDGGSEAGEMLREADGWRDDKRPALPDGFVSLAGGWLRRRREVFFPFFRWRGEYQVFTSPPLLL